jgi:uncharacterized protein
MKPFTFFTAFEGRKRIASGALADVAAKVKDAMESETVQPVLIYDDATGRLIDIDTRKFETPQPTETVEEPSAAEGQQENRGRGRPRLGVVAREVTLLPRHWEWLATQPGGASVALRKLVDEARRTSGDRDRLRAAQEAAYQFMSSMAGDFPGFEEASRALFANDRRRFGELVASWPEDVRDHAVKLAFSDLAAE